MKPEDKAALAIAAAVGSLIFLVTGLACAAEADYVKRLCPQINGQQEVVLTDGTRVDCLTVEHAIEFDFDKKWAESIGQSLHYAQMTGRQPRVVLIGDGASASKIRTIANYYGLPITVLVIPEE